jgi:hypothetical protein
LSCRGSWLARFALKASAEELQALAAAPALSRLLYIDVARVFAAEVISTI